MSEITVPHDYNHDRNEINQEELLASLGLNLTSQTRQVQKEDENSNIRQEGPLKGIVSKESELTEQNFKVDRIQTSNPTNREEQKTEGEHPQQVDSSANRREMHQYMNNNQDGEEQPVQSQMSSQRLQHLNETGNAQGSPLNIQTDPMELLTITIDLGNGNQENILVRDGDSPYDLAHTFSLKHGLNQRLEDLLALQIINNIEQVLQERQQQILTENHAQDNQDKYNYNCQGEQQDATSKVNEDPEGEYDQKFSYEKAQQEPSQSQQNFSPFRADQSTIKFHLQYPYMQAVPKINSNSKKMLQNKRPNSSHQTIYDRLHKMELGRTKLALAKQLQEEHEQQQNQLKQRRSPDRKSNPNEFNIGVRLYQKGIKKQEERERFCKDAKTLKETKNQQDLVFSPQFVTHQRNKSASRNGEKSQGKREEHLISYGKQLREKKDKARVEISHYEEAKYNYKPKINRKSEMIVSEKDQLVQLCNNVLPHQQDTQENEGMLKSNLDQKSPNQSVMRNPKYSELYEDAKQRQQRQDTIYKIHVDKECTFKPQLVAKDGRLNRSAYLVDKSATKNSQKNSVIDLSNCNSNTLLNEDQADVSVSNINDTTIKSTKDNQVFQRLSMIAKKKLERQSLQVSKSYENIDPHTGKPYFQPQTGRSPKKHRPEASKVGEHLYNQHKKIQQKHLKLKREEEMKHSEMRRQVHQSHKMTEKLVESNKRQRLSDIFDILDSDMDGQISAVKVDLHTLSTELLEIFSPLLCEMEELGQPLDRDEFVDASVRMFNVLNIHQRNQIMSFRRIPRLQTDENMKGCTFHPQVNNISSKIIDRQSDYYSQPIAERLWKKKQDTQNKIRMQKDLKERGELLGCTFQPSLSTNLSNQYFQNYISRGANCFLNTSKGDNADLEQEDHSMPVQPLAMMTSNMNFQFKQ